MRTSTCVPFVPVLAAALALTGCTSADSTPSDGSDAGALTTAASATVLQKSDGPVLCLGSVGQSYPPTCDGPPVSGWDWETVDHERTNLGDRWGTYDVAGSWDGSQFTLTEQPVPSSTPADDTSEVSEQSEAPGEPKAVAQALVDYTDQLVEHDGVLMTTELDGRAHVLVVFDDGTMQGEADDRYGSDVVIIESRLRPALQN